MTDFKINIDSGVCPGGTITLSSDGNDICKLHIEAGYSGVISDASIDLSLETAKMLVQHLNGIINVEEVTRGIK